MTVPHKRFLFDTVFDDDGGIASEPVRVKKVWTADEVELERAKALAEGERSVTVRA
jgi:flagellar assembly protein FliH